MIRSLIPSDTEKGKGDKVDRDASCGRQDSHWPRQLLLLARNRGFQSCSNNTQGDRDYLHSFCVSKIPLIRIVEGDFAPYSLV